MHSCYCLPNWCRHTFKNHRLTGVVGLIQLFLFRAWQWQALSMQVENFNCVFLPYSKNGLKGLLH